MNWQQSDLDAKGAYQQQKDHIPPGRRIKGGDEVCDYQTVARSIRGKQHEAHEKQILTKQCEAHVNGACTTSGGRAIISYQAIGGQADERIKHQKTRKVGGEEYSDAANEREQPANWKAPADALSPKKTWNGSSCRDP
jgi:hypothetical protein